MKIRKIAILGGTGFVGRTLANHLTQEGYELRVLTRNRERNRSNMILLPTLELVETDIHDSNQLEKSLEGCDMVINLVGILNERGRKGRGFEIVHVELVRSVLAACGKNNIKRLLHMSALNADVNGPSYYLKTKGQAEQLIKESSEHGIKATIFRPSVIFGPDDSFLNRFAGLLRMMPLVFPLACPNARFCPVYVGDVAMAFCHAINDPETYGRSYDLCGPDSYTLMELVTYVADLTGKKKIILPLSDWLSRLQAAVFDFVPGKPFSTDNYLSTKIDSVCSHNDLPLLGISPVPLTSVAPMYLGGRTQRANYYRYRSEVHRTHTG